ncbi:MAG: M48 family metallopeptidase [Deltaproteobacteria bacterium]|nr:M48 family metallopeptidase [Deltaproteobacteria bacterium]
MKYTPREPADNVNVSPTSPLHEFFILTSGLLAILIGIYLVLGFTVDLIVPHISTSFEKKLAGPFLSSINTKETDSNKEGFVQYLVDDLQKNCAKLPYEFKVVVRQSNTINALALPGGHIVVFTGLLDKITSENELAFVMAHEMGHYANRDHLKGVGRAFVIMTISALVFGADSGINNLLAKGLTVTELSFSRKQEMRADEFALQTIDCLYGHTGGAIDFFKKIPKEKNPGKFGHYFASHPENLKRITRLEEIIHTKGLKVLNTKPLPDKI